MGMITRNPLKIGLTVANGKPSDSREFSCVGFADEVAALRALMTEYPLNLPHEFGGMIVVGYSPGPVIGPNSAYTYNVNYGVPDRGNTEDPEEDLLSKPPKVESFSQDFFQEVCEFDKFGKPICNSAGDPMDPPGMVDRVREVIVFSRYKKSYVASDYEGLIGCLNHADIVLPTIGLVPARKGRILSIKPAGGYDATVGVPVDTSDTWVYGDSVTWGTGDGAGSAKVNRYDSDAQVLWIFNASNDISEEDVLTTGAKDATATADVRVPRVKIFWTLERRLSGFDYPVADKGYRGWFVRSDVEAQYFLGHIRTRNDGAETATPIYLHEGKPSDEYSFNVGNANFNGWIAQDAIADRVDDGEIVRTSCTISVGTGTISIDLLTFKKIDEADWSSMGL